MPDPATDPATGPSTTPLPSSQRRAMLAGIGGLAAGALLAGKAHAGPLDPPPGPIAPTPGPEPRTPLDQQNTPGTSGFIYRITQPGSYYLTGNLTAGANEQGILIESRGVTLDLNGFNLFSGAGFPGGYAIRGGFEATDVCIRNGTIRGWTLGAIRLESTFSGSQIIEDLQITQAGAVSIFCLGSAHVARCNVRSGEVGIQLGGRSTVSDCAVNVGSHAIIVGESSIVQRCIASGANNGNGIDAGFGSVVRRCVARGNALTGILAAGGSTVEHCNATLNIRHGIQIAGDGTVRQNDCAANGQLSGSAGIRCTGTDARIEHNNCTNNGIGIQVSGTGNIILGNTCSGSLANNYDIAAGNRYGPIVNLTAQTAPAAVGSSAADTTTTAHPWANFAY